MKRLMVFALVFVCVIMVCSCGGNSQEVIATVFGDNVTTVNVTHIVGGQTTNWSVEGKQVDALRAWFNGLNYKHFEVQDGQDPGAVNGGEIYTFEFPGVDWYSFSYVINGEKECYILNSDGEWFLVKRPSNPPLTAPTE